MITSVPCCCSFGLSTKELNVGLTPLPTSEGQQRTKSGIRMITIKNKYYRLSFIISYHSIDYLLIYI